MSLYVPIVLYFSNPGQLYNCPFSHFEAFFFFLFFAVSLSLLLCHLFGPISVFLCVSLYISRLFLYLSLLLIFLSVSPLLVFKHVKQNVLPTSFWFSLCFTPFSLYIPPPPLRDRYLTYPPINLSQP
jgi:hypothetical protein